MSEKQTHKIKEIKIRAEFELLSILVMATSEQQLMLKGYLKKEAIQDMNYWINHSNKFIFKHGWDKGITGEYMGLFTDQLHELLDGYRTVLIERQLNEKQ